MSSNSLWTGTDSQIRIDYANNGVINKPVGFDWIETKPKVITPTLTVSKTSMSVGDSVTLTCDLTSAREGRNVAFFVNIKGTSTPVAGSPAPRVADSSGVATWIVTAASDWVPAVSAQAINGQGISSDKLTWTVEENPELPRIVEMPSWFPILLLDPLKAIQLNSTVNYHFDLRLPKSDFNGISFLPPHPNPPPRRGGEGINAVRSNFPSPLRGEGRGEGGNWMV